MFNPTKLVIESYVERLRGAYQKAYGVWEPDYPGVIAFAGKIAMENIAQSDAPYHDLNHTIMVTEVGQQILLGKQISEGGVAPQDWLHVVVALLCHDIGYLRGVCQGDGEGGYVTGEAGKLANVSPGATDAALTAFHVDRGKIFARERFGHVEILDAERLQEYIEITRFPIPEAERNDPTTGFPGIVRAADLIGQMADIHYLRKCAALFREFQETGAADALGYQSAADLRTAYPKFFWNQVRPVISEALRYLSVTQEGKVWVNNLYANVFIEEHQESSP